MHRDVPFMQDKRGGNMQYKLSKTAENMGLYSNGLVPSTPGSAGIDLYAAIASPVILRGDSDDIVEVPTGLHLWAGKADFAIFLMPRGSSMYQLTNGIGLIDSDYQGELIAKVRNPWTWNKDVVIQPGEKFAQAVLLHILSPYNANLQRVDEFEYITSRGVGRHGSTGK